MKRFDLDFFKKTSEPWDGIKPDEFLDYLLPKCQEIITFEQLREKIAKHPVLKVKFGIDPTASEIHIGHIVPVMLLRQFAKAGHHIDVIIGDFTARIGDPTGRDVSRSSLNQEQITNNMGTYSQQIGKFIDLHMLNIHYNSEWLTPLPLQDIFSIFQQINLSEAIQRDDFRNRIRNDQAVTLAEVCYGVLMGMDSVHLDTDIEIGGIDQLLNFQQCRRIMRLRGMEEESVLMTPILEGTNGDGKKMSKSYNNYIAVNASYEDKFGKIMSIPDHLIEKYFCCFADIHKLEIPELNKFIEINPLEAKKQLATFVVALETKDINCGLQARETFERRFSKKLIELEDCIEVIVEKSSALIAALMKSGKFKSKSELRRLFDQKGIKTIEENREVILTPEVTIEQVNGVVRVGKRFYFRFIT